MRINGTLKSIKKFDKYKVEFYFDNTYPMLKVTHKPSQKTLSCQLNLAFYTDVVHFNNGNYHNLSHDIELFNFKCDFMFDVSRIGTDERLYAYLSGLSPYMDFRTLRHCNSTLGLRELLAFLSKYDEYCPRFFQDPVINGTDWACELSALYHPKKTRLFLFKTNNLDYATKLNIEHAARFFNSKYKGEDLTDIYIGIVRYSQLVEIGFFNED